MPFRKIRHTIRQLKYRILKQFYPDRYMSIFEMRDKIKKLAEACFAIGENTYGMSLCNA